MIGILLLFVGLANAGAVGDNVVAARQSLAEKDVERAMSLLVQARMSVGNEQEILDAATIAQLVYLEGIGPRILGAERERDKGCPFRAQCGLEEDGAGPCQDRHF